MFGLSLGEVLFLGILALIVIGPRQLPELARNLGRLMNEIRRATDGFTDDLKRQTQLDLDPLELLKPKTPSSEAEGKESTVIATNPPPVDTKNDGQ